MSRTNGLASFSANFEPQISSPLDARQIVTTFADLTLTATWEANDGGVYTYVGMLVAVTNDGNNNGLYRLTASDYTDINNWVKLMGSEVYDPSGNASDLYVPYNTGSMPFCGFENRTDSTLDLTGGVLTVAAVADTFRVWVNGERFDISSDTVGSFADKETTIVYYDTSGVLNTTTGAVDFYSATQAPVALVYRDGSNYSLNDERHNYRRNTVWHAWAHHNIGTVYDEGLSATFGDNSLSIAQGVIWDEDLKFDTGGTITDCSLWYRDGSGSMRMIPGQSVPYATAGGELAWDDNGTLTAVDTTGGGRYVVNWIYATTDANYPIYVVAGQEQVDSISEAQDSLPPAILLNTAEWKLIYRVLYRNVAGTATYIGSEDFRSVQTGIPTTGFTPTSHSALINRSAANSHPADAISVDASGFSQNLDGTVTDVQLLASAVDELATTDRYPLAPGVNSNLTLDTRVVEGITITPSVTTNEATMLTTYRHTDGRLRKFYVHRLYRTSGNLKWIIYRENDDGSYSYWREGTRSTLYPVEHFYVTGTTSQDTITMVVTCADNSHDADVYDYDTAAIDPTVIELAIKQYYISQAMASVDRPQWQKTAWGDFIRRLSPYLADGTSDTGSYEDGNPFAVMLACDSHGDWGDWAERVTWGLLQSAQVYTRIRGVLFGGDQLSNEGGNLTDTEFIAQMADYESDVIDELARIDMIPYAAIGNHDTNTKHNSVATTVDSVGYALTKAQQRSTFIEDMLTADASVVCPAGECYWYRDWTDAKVRLIVLDPYCTPETNDGTDYTYQRGHLYFGEDQMAWLHGTALDLPDADYRVIVFVHQALDDSSYNGTYGSNENTELQQMLADFNSQSSGSMSVSLTASALDYTEAYDFSSGYAAGKVVAVLAGHEHTPRFARLTGDIRQYVAVGADSNASPGMTVLPDTPQRQAGDCILYRRDNDTLGNVRWGRPNVYADGAVWCGEITSDSYGDFIADASSGTDDKHNWLTVPQQNYTATPASTSQITMAKTDAISVGTPLRYTYGGATYYGVVTAVTDNTSITIAGAPLNTGSDLTRLEVGSNPVDEIVYTFYGEFSLAADSAMIENQLLSVLDAYAATSYIVGFSVHVVAEDTGISQPRINVTLGGNAVCTSNTNAGLEINETTIQETAVDINSTNYVWNYGSRLEVTVDANADNGDATDCTVTIWRVRG